VLLLVNFRGTVHSGHKRNQNLGGVGGELHCSGIGAVISRKGGGMRGSGYAGEAVQKRARGETGVLVLLNGKGRQKY